MAPDGDPRRVTLTPVGLLGSAVALGLLVLMVVLLVLMLLSINRLEGEIVKTNDRVSATNDRIGGLSQDLDPVAELSPPFFRRGLPYLATTRRDLEQVSNSIPAVERALAAVASAVIPLADELRGASIAGTLAAANRALVDIDRLALLPDANRALEAVPEVVDSLGELRQDFRDTREVLCEMGEHLRSIDRKTGGDVTDGEPEPPPEPCRGRDSG